MNGCVQWSAQAADDLARRYIYGPGMDRPVAMIDFTTPTPAWYYYYQDALGNVAALSNNDGNLAESYRYTPFGSVTFFDIAGQPTGASAVQNPYLFTARRYDDETGLYYYRARMYNPQLGRFMQPDPIGYHDAMNLYQYCGNNPVNWTDPWGLMGVIPTWLPGWIFTQTIGPIPSRAGEITIVKSFKECPPDNTQQTEEAGKWFPVPGMPRWEYHGPESHGPNDPVHYQFREGQTKYARRVLPDGSQSPHGQGVNKDVPKKVLKKFFNKVRPPSIGGAPILLIVPRELMELCVPGYVRYGQRQNEHWD